jgi:branched-chain amino acid transport system ATP-binding protein
VAFLRRPTAIADAAPGASPGASDEALLTCTGVTTRYGATVAIRDVSLEVHAGEIVTILGANGAGKTTMLSTIVGLTPAAEGRIVFDGRDITRGRTESVVGRGVTLVPEGRRVFEKLTVYENLRLGAGLQRQGQVARRFGEMVDLFPVLETKRDDFAGLLSGGEQQQLAIARALMCEPKLLLLDEPSLGLAPLIVTRVFELICALRDRGITIVLVEQNVDRALAIADRAYVLSTGHVELSGDAAQLREGSGIEDAYLGLGAAREP